MERIVCGERKGSAHDPPHTSSSPQGGGNTWLLLGWAHSSSLMISIRFLSASLERDGTKLIGRSFTMQQDNDPKHTAKTTKEFIRGKKWKVLDRLGQSPD